MYAYYHNRLCNKFVYFITFSKSPHIHTEGWWSCGTVPYYATSIWYQSIIISPESGSCECVSVCIWMFMCYINVKSWMAAGSRDLPNAYAMLSYIEDYILFLCAIEEHRTHELWSLRCMHNNNSL